MTDEDRALYRKNFGKRLEMLMKNRHWTRETFSEAIGVSWGSLSGYINGKIEPTLYVIVKMARTLPCSADILLDTKGEWEE